MDVKFLFNHWAGEWKVEREDSRQIVLHSVEIRGHSIDVDNVRLVTDGPFLTLWLREIPDEGSPYFIKSNRSVRELREELTADEWLDDTTDEVLVLPISRMEWVERVYAEA